MGLPPLPGLTGLRLVLVLHLRHRDTLPAAATWLLLATRPLQHARVTTRVQRVPRLSSHLCRAPTSRTRDPAASAATSWLIRGAEEDLFKPFFIASSTYFKIVLQIVIDFKFAQR